MEVASLGYRTDLLVRRCAGSDVVDRGDHLVVRTPANPDFYWGNFVLVASPLAAGDAPRWLSVFSAEFPEAHHVAIGVDGTNGEVGDVSGFLAMGLEIEASTVLTAAGVKEPSRSCGGALCRPLVSDDDWGQVLELRQAVASDDGRDSSEYQRFLVGGVKEARRLAKAGHATQFGAFIDGHLWSTLGLVGDRGGLARFQNVETHPDRRRQGLATALTYAAGQYGIGHMGAHKLVIVADPDGPAIGLYLALGFVDTERQVALSGRAQTS